MYFIAGGVVVFLAAAVYWLTSRRPSTTAPQASEPADTTQPDPPPQNPGRSRHASPVGYQPAPLPIDPEQGTTKIDRAALRSLVDDDSAVEEAYFLVIAGEGIGRFIKLDRDEHIIGRDPKLADIFFLDDTISKQHARVCIRDGAVVIQDLGSSNGTFVDGDEVDEAVLRDGARVVLGQSTVLTLTFQDELGEQFQQKMYESSTRDQLTGAYNKATFFDLINSEMHFALRHRTNYCIVMLDIDHFKNINDTYGHVAGDEILAQVADVIGGVTRDESLFVRYGGEEFIVGERDADLGTGAVVAERIRKAIGEHGFETSAGTIDVTVSLGVADLTTIDELDGLRLVEAADSALYEAKEGGRNRVCLAPQVQR